MFILCGGVLIGFSFVFGGWHCRCLVLVYISPVPLVLLCFLLIIYIFCLPKKKTCIPDHCVIYFWKSISLFHWLIKLGVKLTLSTPLPSCVFFFPSQFVFVLLDFSFKDLATILFVMLGYSVNSSRYKALSLQVSQSLTYTLILILSCCYNVSFPFPNNLSIIDRSII